MHRSWVSLVCALLAIALASSARGVTPKRDQSAAQQEKDQYECRRWAVAHTGFDPKNPPSAPPRKTGVQSSPVAGLKGDPVLRKVQRRDEEMARKKQQEQHKAKLEAQRVKYERAVKTCLEGRNYSVN